MRKIDITGQKYHHLTVLRRGETRSRRPGATQFPHWWCRCDCGTELQVAQGALRSGNTKSCKKCGTQRSADKITTHGHTRISGSPKGTKEFRTWLRAKNRCHNPNDQKYYCYGARGIQMCEEWRNSFEAFFAELGPAPSPQHSIDRIDVNKGYEPGNVRWATAAQQMNNMRRNIYLEWKNEKMTISEIARLENVSYERFRVLVRNQKKNPEEAIAILRARKSKRITGCPSCE